MVVIVAVATNPDGAHYRIRAEVNPGAPIVVWRVADGMCDGREFCSVEVCGGGAEGDLERALGAGWSVRMEGVPVVERSGMIV